MTLVTRRRTIPGQDLRLTQYHRNKATLNDVNGLQKKPNDWIVTITFYAALHLVEKNLIAKKGQKLRLHEERYKLVIEDEVLGEDVADAYLALYNDCLIARYDCIPITAKQATDAIQYLELIEDKLP